MLVFSSKAPTSMATTAAVLRAEPLPEPPPGRESAARPASITVNTVVVKSGTASRRTVAFRVKERGGRIRRRSTAAQVRMHELHDHRSLADGGSASLR